MRNGGYEDGYQKSNCFWGTTPGQLLGLVENHITVFNGLNVLDAGCGEGKNAAYLAKLGAKVTALDVSKKAISNGKHLWGNTPGINWVLGDISAFNFKDSLYDMIIGYGLLHCLRDHAEVGCVLEKFSWSTKSGGLNIICAFNSRKQELDAHPGFRPLLLDHNEYLEAYSDWTILHQSDQDLTETHPHNKITHTHSLTRLIAKKT